VAFGTFITWKVNECKTCPIITQFFVEKNEWGKGQTGGKIATVLLY